MIRQLFLCDKSHRHYRWLYQKLRPAFAFHIRKEAREFYQVNEELFQQSGNVIFTNFFQVRVLAQKINKKRNVTLYPERAIKAGQINAIGLIDEILHYV
jgi:hypothetical protein